MTLMLGLPLLAVDIAFNRLETSHTRVYMLLCGFHSTVRIAMEKLQGADDEVQVLRVWLQGV